ncbi:beta-galactosidase [Lichenicoccus roseus]|uniref:Beta-galactosidase n=1 Tax=Lichenicoccus roseus TaxID=2683649 RepID=A0A5R9J6U0_9PROT|nr:beta-galactosidase [Lichenicoccus roseus]TLU73325.1 beta-galactosidase [Lichenicoccus roseus]
MKTDRKLSAWRTLSLDRFLLGVPHYPEHVDPAFLERDARRIAAAGFNVVRMGEFAWNLFEPRPGQYDFALFDRAVEVFASHGVSTMMCTPTATPPRWLTHAEPDLLRVTATGAPHRHGSRQHADNTSPRYREHSRRITRIMAEHYRDMPGVIGWQTDNELNTSYSESYSAAAASGFRDFLRERHGSVERLNEAWGGRFWAQDYLDFDHVDPPYPMAPVAANPSHVLDYHRYLAHATAMFQRDQVEILRAVNPDWFITHNIGVIRDIDMRGALANDLDFLSYDVYPLLKDEFQRAGHAWLQAVQLDLVRGAAGNLVVPEQQSGFGSQPGFATVVPEPGEMRRMAYSSIARGVDGLMFFRWRPAHYGAEIYWMGVIDHDDVPRRRYDEAARFAGEVGRMAATILGTTVHMDVGIAGPDFDNEEGLKAYPLGLPGPEEASGPLHRHCYERGIACGFVHPEDEIGRLKLYFVPHWALWEPRWTAPLAAFVEAGGVLVIGARTGAHTPDNHMIASTPPGALRELAGVAVTEFGPLPPPGANALPASHRTPPHLAALPAESSRRRHAIATAGGTVDAGWWYECLAPDQGTETIATWSTRFLAGVPAVTARAVGRGLVVYVGSFLTPELVEMIFPPLFARAGIEPLLRNLPAGVEVTRREAADRQLLFVQNTRSDPVALAGIPRATELVTGARIEGGTLDLEPYGCGVLRPDRTV